MSEPLAIDQESIRQGDVVVITIRDDLPREYIDRLRDQVRAEEQRCGIRILLLAGARIDVTTARTASVLRALNALEAIAKADILDTRLHGDDDVVLAIKLWQEAREACRDLGVDVGPDGFRP